MNLILKRLILISLLIMLSFKSIPASAQTSLDDVPMIGAEVFIEPGQTPGEIDGWFKRMKENGMTITRIRMFECYMHKPDGTWDFTLFDTAFKAGEKYGIKIYANLFPSTSFVDLGGLKFPKSDEQLASIGDYIRHLTQHFKTFTSLYGWVPVNEPGNGGVPGDEFSRKKFTEWKKNQPAEVYKSKGYEVLDFSEPKFLLYYNTWFLNWLTDQIHQNDPGRPVHVNNHNIFQNAAEYNFPEWRKFLTSLGGSAHASWHFDYFTRQHYAVAMSANSEILRSGAGNIPWLMTELQGGNNTYSGNDAMCPTKEETAQWLWTTLATGSKGAIFWCLNPRSSGIEAGEWALLDFQDNPSDRMLAAASVTGVINANSKLFANARVAESGVNILYIREALWVEKKLRKTGTSFTGRDIGAVMKSALSYFEAFSELGIQANLKSIDEFDFTAQDYSGKSIVLADQISVPSRYWPKLEYFVTKGGKLIVDGLTAYYDENAFCLLRPGFPMEKLFGGDVKEYKVVDTIYQTKINDLTLPAHLWQGTIAPKTGIPQGRDHDETIALKNHFGNGEVFWMPSLLGLGARERQNYDPLSQLLVRELKGEIALLPLRFQHSQPNMMMKVLRSGNSLIAVIINKSKRKQQAVLQMAKPLGNPVILYADKSGGIRDRTVNIASEETIVIKWEL